MSRKQREAAVCRDSRPGTRPAGDHEIGAAIAIDIPERDPEPAAEVRVECEEVGTCFEVVAAREVDSDARATAHVGGDGHIRHAVAIDVARRDHHAAREIRPERDFPVQL